MKFFFLQLIDKHKVVLDETRAEYNKLNKTMEELRASEVFRTNFAFDKRYIRFQFTHDQCL